MNDDILVDVKLMLGIPEHVNNFDTPLKMYCNTVFSTLTQLGVGPAEGFFIGDNKTSWWELIGDHNIQNVKSYVYLKIKLLFDPPANATLIDVIKSQIDEIEWRIRVEVDKPL